MSACLDYSYTQKDEYVKEPSMSAAGTKRTSATRPTMSVSGAKADLAGGQPDF